MSSSHTVQRGRLRIIGGEWKKRLIRFNGGAGLRPTPDSVRETLFNWLSPVIFNAECLDLFAEVAHWGSRRHHEVREQSL